ncbi:MAG: hypothetical protein COZ18_08240 [Flexibacter sp. CG_4_10_14_3_um_filter_32_15]|nr:MAG: hypothetical protein COZ18_08240 [Flexibacter sp. CG_4_10_14_3_um_filter_32_15]
MNTTTTTTFLKNPFLIWVFSLFLHSILLVLVYSVFWASYSKPTLDFLYHLSNQINTDNSTFSFLSWFLIISLGFGFSAVFAQLFASLSELNQKIRVLILYTLVFFVAFIPMLLWLDRHVVATICVLSGVSLLVINFKKNTSFYINSFVGTLLCLVGLFWSVKGFGWAMAASIPFSLWYLKKENFKNQIPQVVILVSLVMLALVWDLIQNEVESNKTSIHFSAEKIEKNVPQWLLDEYLIEVGWTKNDFRLWLSGFEGFGEVGEVGEVDLKENNKTNQHFSKKAIQEITDFLLHYDSVFPVEGNPILEFGYVLLQIALLVFWFLFLGNYNLSRYRLITYWVVIFLIWAWTEYVSLDAENGFLLALCAYGGLLPLIGANKFKDIVSFKIHQKIIFIGIIVLIIIELSGSLAVYISESLATRQKYVEAKAVLENIYNSYFSDKKTYIDWNAHLNNKTSLPFSTSVTSKFDKEQLQNNLVIPIQNLRNKENLTENNTLNFSNLYFILPSKTSKSQKDMLTLYFSEHQNKLIEWQSVWKTEEIEVWKLIAF